MILLKTSILLVELRDTSADTVEEAKASESFVSQVNYFCLCLNRLNLQNKLRSGFSGFDIEVDIAMDASSSKDEKLTETQVELQEFFPKIIEEVKQIKNIEPGNQLLPLARIKKIMKLDEDVKMISAEAPLLFAKATEIFIHELTLRAWLHTEDNKRRTLQRNDIAMAISKYDQFDFLIDIVPRDEIKPKKEEIKSPVQSEVFYVSPSQGIQTVTVPTMTQQPTQTIQLTQNGMQATSPQQSQIILQSPTQPQQVPNLIQIGNPNQQIQLLQQVVGANGEIQQIPVDSHKIFLLQVIHSLSLLAANDTKPTFDAPISDAGTTVNSPSASNYFPDAIRTEYRHSTVATAATGHLYQSSDDDLPDSAAAAGSFCETRGPALTKLIKLTKCLFRVRG